jgi:hypothetical protein
MYLTLEIDMDTLCILSLCILSMDVCDLYSFVRDAFEHYVETGVIWGDGQKHSLLDIIYVSQHYFSILSK